MGRRDEDVQLVFVCYCVFVKLSWLWTVVEMLHEYHGSCFTQSNLHEDTDQFLSVESSCVHSPVSDRDISVSF